MDQSQWNGDAHDRAAGRVFGAAPDLLDTWVNQWNDLVDFEIVPVVTSAEYWIQTRPD